MNVSVVVPVYNCEKFITDFVKCLRRQTHQEFEVIFVDDCSTDTTPQLLQEAVEKDDRFFYYRNPQRMGAARSRNRGIEVAKGTYILCLDADDVFENDLLEQLLSVAFKHDADVVMLEREDINGYDLNAIRREKHVFEDEKQLYKNKVFSVKDQPIDFLLRCKNATYDRMVRRELLDKYQIRFQSLKNSNDVFYILASTFCAEKIVHTNCCDNLYHRRIHSEPSRISNSRDPMCALQALQAVYNHLKMHDLWDTYCIYFWVFALDSLEKQLFVCKDEERQREVYQYMQKEGLFELGVKADKNYERLPEALQMQYERLAVLRFDEKCFCLSMVTEALCQIYSDKIKELVDRVGGKKNAIWGVGRITPVFIEAFEKQKGEISFVIDNDIHKQGKAVCGYPIVSYESVCDKIDIIFVSNRNYYDAIREQILAKRQNIEMISLEEVIYS